MTTTCVRSISVLHILNGNCVTLVGNGLKFTVAKRLINLVIYSYSLPVILIL